MLGSSLWQSKWYPKKRHTYWIHYYLFIGCLLILPSVEVLATLTSDVGRILSKLHQVQPNGSMNLLTGIRIAHVSVQITFFACIWKSYLWSIRLFQLALKHRQGKNHKMRIVVFVGSPITADEKDLVKLAKRLKKEKVNVDLVSFGEELSVSSEIKWSLSFSRCSDLITFLLYFRTMKC